MRERCLIILLLVGLLAIASSFPREVLTNPVFTNPTVTGQLVFTNTVWDDLMIPGFAAKAGATAPTFTTYKTNFMAWLFAGSGTDDQIYFTVQLPHSYKIGSDAHPHVHWAETVAPGAADRTNVVWEFLCTWQSFGQIPQGETTVLCTNSISGTNCTHMISELPAISGVGKGISSMMNCRLRRLASGSASDTYDQPVAFLQFDIHFQKDTVGSLYELQK